MSGTDSAGAIDSTMVVTGPPVFTGAVDGDAAVLAGFVAETERAVAALPTTAERDPGQRRLAREVMRSVDEARDAFLARHVEPVYDRLTAGRTRYPRLPELVRAAAHRFPGLVPSAAQLAAEQTVVQADKEGHELGQAVFCAAVLRSPVAGRHLVEAMSRPTPRALELAGEFAATGRIALRTVSVRREGVAGHVTFHNTHCLNAEDNRLIADMETAVDLVLLDDEVRVGVLRGGEVDHPKYRGRRVFSAGINLTELGAGRIPFVEFLMGRELGYLNKILRGLRVGERSVQKPWAGVVDGFAIGGGMQLLLVVDRVIAEEGAYLSLPAAEEGIVPGLANLRLTRLVGGRVARQIVLGGRRIATDDPQAPLLFDDVVPPAQVDEVVGRAIAELSAPAVAANRRMLNLAEEPVDLFREYLAEFARVQAARSYSADVLAKLARWRRPARDGG